MAARRSLGGGRVLGSGKNLAPPVPKRPNTEVPVRNEGIVSPSESSLSLGSQGSSTPTSIDREDLTSRVALDEQGHGSAQAAAAASSRMVCPICNEEMTTLLQLNRHIDDNHSNLKEVEQEEAKDWFEEQMKKAKKFQPFQLINQKLRGLEVFESNNDAATHPHPVSRTPSAAHRATSPTPVPPPVQSLSAPDPDDVISKTHWQRPMGQEPCADPLCGKRLGATNGQINCRCCGRLFCEEHTMYQMKLSRSAQHEPVRGMWYRVCETCYKTREGYNDHNGLERNHIGFFTATRRRNVDKQYLETSRLETRLTRLTQLLADPPPPDPKQWSIWSTIAGDREHLKSLEQTIVPWEDDATVTECPFCQQTFSQYTFRRHHCRICGRVVCGDPGTACSTEIGLNVDRRKDLSSTLDSRLPELFRTDADFAVEKSGQKVPVDVRMCKDCQRMIFSKADFARELAAITVDQRAFENLGQFEYGIRLLLPRFQKLLKTLQSPEDPPSPAQLAEAGKVRKRLTDAFTKYDFAARRMRDLPTESPTQARLQKAVYHQATNFLHLHMLPLKSLPKLMKHATPNGKHAPHSADARPQGALSAINYNKLTNGGEGRPGTSRNSSTSSAAVTALEAEEKQLRERLIVIEEQKFIVENMIADANKRRKFDEVASLAQNVEDLSLEIDQLLAQLDQMDFAGAYTGEENVIK